MSTPDPLEHIERLISEMHDMLNQEVKPVYKKYPLFFLLLATASVAALFHGLDRVMDHIAFLDDNPLFLVLFGILGLFLTGSLYKRLGKDKFE